MKKIKDLNRQLPLWAVAGVLEILSLASFIGFTAGDRYWLIAVIPVFHIAAALVFFFPIPVTARSHDALTAYERHLYGWLMLLIPYAGFAGSLLSAMTKVLVAKHSDVEIYKEMTRHELVRGLFLSANVEEQVLIMESLDVEPIQDILDGGDTMLKLGAIRLLSLRPSPLSVTLLRKALSDRLEEVRYVAHLALINIEEYYTGRIRDCQQVIQEARNDLAPAYANLGKAYRQYAESGLEDEKTRQFHLERAYEAFRQAYDRRPDHATALSLGEICLERGAAREAVTFFQRVLADPTPSFDARLGLWRSFFEAGDLVSLDRAVQETASPADYGTDDPQKIVLFEFWKQPREASLAN